jgi:hypothetical protein
MKQKIALIAAALLIGGAAAYAQARGAGLGSAPVAAGPADAAAASSTARFAEALQLYRSGRWAAAYGRFVKLADRGHADAARMALMMLRHGPDLYDTEWAATPEQVAVWTRVADAATPLRVVVVSE